MTSNLFSYTMIHQIKKKNPILGVIIGILLAFFGAMGVILLFGEVLKEWMIFSIAIPFILIGVTFMGINMTFIGITKIAKHIDECASSLMLDTFIGLIYSITKIRDNYILKTGSNYLSIIRMKDKQVYSATWIRKVFWGPKPVVSETPFKRPIVAEYQGFKIQKSEGNAVLYDSVEDRWISGSAIMYSIPLYTQPLSTLLYPSVFENLINLIEQLG
jgi:hypothetical protein